MMIITQRENMLQSFKCLQWTSIDICPNGTTDVEGTITTLTQKRDIVYLPDMCIDRNSMILIKWEQSNARSNLRTNTWQSAKSLNHLRKFLLTQWGKPFFTSTRFGLQFFSSANNVLCPAYLSWKGTHADRERESCPNQYITRLSSNTVYTTDTRE